MFPITDPVIVFALVTLLILLVPFAMAKLRMPGMVGLLLAGAILGDNALGVLTRDQSFILLGKVGIIYIMFTAALEVDLGVFKRYRVHAGVFGVLTFAVPMGLGTAAGLYVLGFTLPTAVLLASLFASHTLLAYPVASRLGLSKSQSVITAVGGTMVTDTAALLVLAIIAGITQGEINEAFWWRLGASLLVYVGLIFVGVPRLGRWLFKRVGDDGSAKFVFVLATVFTCAALAHVAGVEDIVGAFLAGLALNRLIPHNSTLMNRIVFTGEAIFVPFFLLSVGMLLDARVLFGGWRTALVAATMVVSVMLAKWLAAQLSRLVLRMSGDEAQVIYGLSVAQAAATLAAVMVGHKIGLFDDTVVNGSLIMILVTCTLAPILVDRAGQRLAAQRATEALDEKDGPPQRVLVALPDDKDAKRLIDLAIMLRDEAQHQPLYLAHVEPEGPQLSERIAQGEKMLHAAVEHASAAEVESQTLSRVDAAVGPALARARTELRISHLVLAWNGQPSRTGRVIGSVVDPVLARSQAGVVLARLTHPVATTKQIAFAIPPGHLDDASLPHAVQTAKRLAAQTGAPLSLFVERGEADALKKLVARLTPSCTLELKPLEDWNSLNQALADRIGEHDLVVLYGVAPTLAARPELAHAPLHVAQRFAEVNLLVVYGPTLQAAAESTRVTRASSAFLARDMIAGASVGIAPGVSSAADWEDDPRDTQIAP